MKERINTELLNLQDELQKLGQAVTHINRAEEISTTVVEGVKQIQGQYQEHLNQLADLFKETLEKYKAESDEKVNELQELSQKQISEAQTVLKDLQQKSNSIQENADETLKKAAEEYDRFLDQNFLHTKHQMEKVSEAYQSRIDEETEVLAEFT
ncbi:MAG: hypothetical protein KAI79_17975, partial [Bacteroidales bacterium]|nr:hypothetical protein [Bacteroidales bacterium]